MPNLAVRNPESGAVRDVHVDTALYAGSVHGALACRQCHADVASTYPHAFAAPRRAVTCDADCHATDSTGARVTHERQVAAVRASAHRAGLTDSTPASPTCTTCHGQGNPHAIPATGRGAASPRDRLAYCVSCHDDRAVMVRRGVEPDAVQSYRRSFHYKAIRFGETGTAVCQDCHGTHDILPADSAASRIAPANVARTCGQDGCHAGAQLNFAMSGANHLAIRMSREPLLAWLERFFVLLTAGTMAMLVTGIVLDVQRKFGWPVVARRAGVRVRVRAAAYASAARHALRPVVARAWRGLRVVLLE